MHEIGTRIKSERGRLGISQPAFGEIAKATKWTVWNWEKGESFPDAKQLASLAEHGVDVLYVLLGVRGGCSAPAEGAANAREQALIEKFAALKEPDRRVVEQMIESLTLAEKSR